ncbi:MAG: histidine phosphatase family protein [Actinomycetota bacterium]|nr:histidine phosphatase family protein [Actinomycetota bacterium]
MGEVVLVRHGETEWSRSGQHTGRTDIALTPHGEQQARALRPMLEGRRFALVLVSPLARAWRTAELAGLPHPEPEPDLQEWDYGGYEGRTTAEIRRERPGWNLWTDGVPPGATMAGEQAGDVGERLDRVLARARAALGDGDVALVAHGHSLRVTGARWVDLPAASGSLLALDTAAVCVLGFEHERAVIRQWNLPNPAVQS